MFLRSRTLLSIVFILTATCLVSLTQAADESEKSTGNDMTFRKPPTQIVDSPTKGPPPASEKPTDPGRVNTSFS